MIYFLPVYYILLAYGEVAEAFYLRRCFFLVVVQWFTSNPRTRTLVSS